MAVFDAGQIEATLTLDRDPFQKGLKAAQAQAQAFARRTYTAKLDADVTAARRKLDDLKARFDVLGGKTATVDVDAATSAASSRLAAVEAQLDRIDRERAEPTVDVDLTVIEAQLDAVLVLLDRIDGRHVEPNVDVDTAGPMAQAAALQAQLDRLDRTTVTPRVDSSGFTNARLGMQLLVAGAVALGPILVPALAGAAAAALGLGAALSTAAAGLPALLLGFSGIGKAVAALGQQQKTAARTATTFAGSQNQVRSAVQALANARRSAADQAISAAERVRGAEQTLANARRSAADQAISAAERVRSAEQSLRQAERDEEAAVKSLTQARIEARQHLQDLAFATEDADLALRSANLQVKETKANLDALNTSAGDASHAQALLTEAQTAYQNLLADPQATEQQRALAAAAIVSAERQVQAAQAGTSATALQRQEAQLAYDEAVQRQKESRVAASRAAKENADAQKKGIAGSDAVVAAQNRIADAQRRVAQAEQGVADARRAQVRQEQQAAQQIANAQQGLADARRAQARQQSQAAQSIATAERAVADAQHQVGQTSLQAATGLSAVDQAMQGLSPEAQHFARFLFSLKGRLDELRAAAAKGLLPGVEQGIRALLPLMPSLTRFVGDQAKVWGDLFAKAGKALTAPFWRDFYSFLDRTAGPNTRLFAGILGNLAKAAAGLIRAFEPFGHELLTWLEKATGRFADWSRTLGQSQGFKQFMSFVRANGPLVVGMLVSLARAIIQIGIALAPYAAPILRFLTRLFTSVANADPAKIRDVAKAIGLLFLGLTGAKAVSALRNLPILGGLLGLVAPAAPWLLLAGAIGGIGIAAVKASGKWDAFVKDIKHGDIAGAIRIAINAVLGEMKTWATKLARKINTALKTTNWTAVGHTLGHEVITALGFLVTDLGKFLAVIIGFLNQVDWNSAGAALGHLLIGGTSFDKSDSKTFGEKFGDMLTHVSWGHVLVSLLRTNLYVIMARFFTGVGTSIGTWIGNGLHEGGVGTFLTRLLDFFAFPIPQVVGFLTGVFTRVGTSIGNWIADGFKDGVVEGLTRLASLLYGPFIYFITHIKQILGIHSPSTVFYRIGQDIIRGLVNGLLSLLRSIRSAASAIARAITGGIIPGLSTLKHWLGVTLPGAEDTLRQHTKSAFAGLSTNIGNSVHNGIVPPLRTWRDWLTKTLPAGLAATHAANAKAWGSIKADTASGENAAAAQLSQMRHALALTAAAFRGLASTAGKAWREVRDSARAPVRFLITVVYNKGIAAAFNSMAKAVGLEKSKRLDTITPPSQLATGGYVSGPGGPRDDRVPAMLSDGEFVVNAASTRRHFGLLKAINGPRGQGYKDGGKVGAAGVAQQIEPALHLPAFPLGQLQATWNKATKGLAALITGGGMMGSIARQTTRNMQSELAHFWHDYDALGFGNTFIEILRSVLGTPYLWGGMAPGGFDCSGLVWWALNKLGIHAPRTSAAQYKWVKHIGAAAALPGDLAFWDPGHIHHVGVNIGGHKMIDAPHTGAKVRIERIWPHALYGRIPGLAGKIAGLAGGLGKFVGRGIARGQGLAWAIAHGITGDRWRALDYVISHECVPLDTEILTRRGWLKHGAVRVGDETLGYNPATGRNEWTPVTAIHRYDSAPLFRIGSERWSAVTTAEHRWWSDTHRWGPRGGVIADKYGEFVQTKELGVSRSSAIRLRLSAPASTEASGDVADMSLTDVTLLAWLQGDGTITELRRKPVQCPECSWTPSPDKHAPATSVAWHRKAAHQILVADDDLAPCGAYQGSIVQSKPAMVAKIRYLLERTAHSERVVPPAKPHHLERHIFHLPRDVVTPLVTRSGIYEDGPEAFVLAMSPAQRAAWLEAMTDAEGCRAAGTSISQCDGALSDAIALAVYLEGYRPSVRPTRDADHGHRPASTIRLCRPHVTAQRFHPPEPLGEQPVWCPTTGLGTWTMRQGRSILLTGNSSWNPRAQNPRSSAWGLGQLIAANRAHYHYDTSVSKQLAGTVAYMRDRYGGIVPAANFWKCVPLDTQILTRDGWKAHDAVRVGDETLGYNPATGRSEWTRVTHVHHYDSAPIVEMGGSKWRVRSTPNHRWLARHWVQRKRGAPADVVDDWVTTDTVTSRHTLRLAALADTGAGPAITEQEAYLLGWVLGDGSVSDGTMRVYQVKPRWMGDLERLFKDIPHSHYENEMSRGRGVQHTWYVHKAYGADLLDRSGYDHHEPMQFVLSLSPQQRAAFMEGVWQAEGSEQWDYRKTKRVRVIDQADGARQDAIATAVYLEGHRPAIHVYHHRSGNRRDSVRTLLARPYANGITLRRTRRDVGAEPAWCVTTELGSWTARQDRQVFLTGNSHHYYDTGGLADGPGALFKGPGKERVLSTRQTAAFEELIPYLTRLAEAFASGQLDRGGFRVHVEQHAAPGLSSTADLERLMRKVEARVRAGRRS